MKGIILHISVFFAMVATAMFMVWVLDMNYKHCITQVMSQYAGYVVGLTVKDKNK
jgi:hypothetical protein